MKSLITAGALCAALTLTAQSAIAQEPAGCVGLALPTGLICRSDLQCTVPLTMQTAGLPVGSLTAMIDDGTLTCPGCVPGTSAANGQCMIIEDTCNFQVFDVNVPFTAFSDGELARLTVACQPQGLGELCVYPVSAFATDGITEHPVCEPSCVPYACRSCMSGDCNRNERRDGGDTICTARCLVDLASPEANCGCGADCNCVAGTDASDITCSILRNLSAFGRDSLDTCDVPAPASLQFVKDAVSSTVAVRVTEPNVRPSGRKSRAFLALRGSASAQVGALRTTLAVDSGSLIRVRLKRRLTERGFQLEVKHAGPNALVAVVRPPAVLPLPAIERGRVLKIVMGPATSGLAVGAAEVGSTTGLPMTADAAQRR